MSGRRGRAAAALSPPLARCAASGCVCECSCSAAAHPISVFSAAKTLRRNMLFVRHVMRFLSGERRLLFFFLSLCASTANVSRLLISQRFESVDVAAAGFAARLLPKTKEEYENRALVCHVRDERRLSVFTSRERRRRRRRRWELASAEATNALLMPHAIFGDARRQ